MTKELTQLQILTELEPVAEQNLERHLEVAKDWNPHDYVPWDSGHNFAAMGGVDWDPSQSTLSEIAQISMITNLLTEDNLPSYHREVSASFSQDGAWGTWVGRWTAEENRHSIVIRDFLMTTRGVDPVALEEARLAHMTAGPHPPENFGESLLMLIYVTFQELATRVSHRNTGKVCEDPLADRMLQRVSLDENLHMIFYRNVSGAALDLAPDQAMAAVSRVVREFEMPGRGMPNFRRYGVMMAKHGIYDLRQHQHEVVMPLLKHWNVFDRTDFGPRGEAERDAVAGHLEKMSKDVIRFEEQRDRLLAREAARRMANA